MDILFINKKLRNELNNDPLLVRGRGIVQARRIRQRLDELASADCLDHLKKLPACRCHELKGGRKGQISVDLNNPYRLLFEVADVPIPRKSDGGLNWKAVRTVRILSIEDTHG